MTSLPNQISNISTLMECNIIYDNGTTGIPLLVMLIQTLAYEKFKSIPYKAPDLIAILKIPSFNIMQQTEKIVDRILVTLRTSLVHFHRFFSSPSLKTKICLIQIEKLEKLYCVRQLKKSVAPTSAVTRLFIFPLIHISRTIRIWV